MSISTNKDIRSCAKGEAFNLVHCLTEGRDKHRIIWLCNIGAEKFWNNTSTGITDEKEDMLVNRIEEINLLLCRKQDFMILREMPEKAFLEKLLELGFSIPIILIPENADPKLSISQLVLKDVKLQGILRDIAQNEEGVYFVPYAVTYLEEQIAINCSLKLVGSGAGINKKLNDKILNREIAQTLGFNVCKGSICSSVDEISQEFRTLVCSGNSFEKIIVKEPHGASGKGLYIIDDESKLRIYFKRVLKSKSEDKKWLVEGWYKKKHDLNFQLYVSPQGDVDVFSITEQVLSDTVYLGSKFPSSLSEDKLVIIKEYGHKIGKHIFDMGFTGVAGVDSIITEDDVLIPIIEINGRFTLSTYLSYLQNTLGAHKYLSRYFRLFTKVPMPYQKISDILDRKGLLISDKSRSGVFVYNSGTLPSESVKSQELYLGRLFVIIVGRDWREVEELNTRLEQCIASFNELKYV